MLANFTAADRGLPVAWLVVLFVAALTALVSRRRDLAGTTLLAPWWWALVAVVSVGTVELAIAARLVGSNWQEAVRYAAAVSTLLPSIAVMGAKRPQDRGWQWIVFSLWAVLVLPGLQTLLYQPGTPLDLHPAWRIFLLLLILIGCFNTLLTRYRASGMLLATGQVALLLSEMPLARSATAWPMTGATLATASVVLWAWRFPPSPRLEPGVDRLWLEFRDWFGSFWALRVMERFNAAASRYQWPFRLGWHGLTDAEGHAPPPPIPPDVRRTLNVTLESLLRRFVSKNWITERLQADRGPAA